MSPLLRSGAGDIDPRLHAMLTEYQSLRQESLEAIGHRLTVMSFTFAALSVLVAGLLSSKTDALAGVIAIVFLPQLSKAALLIWLGEYERQQRAGHRLYQLEKEINKALGARAMRWENQLASGDVGHMAYPYVAVVVLLLGTGYAGALLGGYFVYEALQKELTAGSVVLALGGIAGLMIVFEAWFLRFFFAQWRKCRRRGNVTG